MGRFIKNIKFYNQTYSWINLYQLENINELLEYEEVKQDFAYIDGFFKLPKELEEISEKEKVEEYIELFNDYLDNINFRYDQISLMIFIFMIMIKKFTSFYPKN